MRIENNCRRNGLTDSTRLHSTRLGGDSAAEARNFAARLPRSGAALGAIARLACQSIMLFRSDSAAHADNADAQRTLHIPGLKVAGLSYRLARIGVSAACASVPKSDNLSRARSLPFGTVREVILSFIFTRYHRQWSPNLLRCCIVL